jgi:acetyltransferase-like isoleucine patch superfamily enzyme
MTGAKLYSLFKPIISFSIYVFSLLPKSIVVFLYDCSVFIPTYFGVFIRYCLVSSISKNIGENVYIGRYVILKNIEHLQVGDNVSVHEFCFIDAIGGIKIGENVSIAHRSSLISFEHAYDDHSKPIKYNRLIYNSITVSDDVWIGAGCSILSGANIPQRTIIAAGSVYKKGTIPNAIYGGVPAQVLRSGI